MSKYNEMNPHTFQIPDRDVVLFSGGVDSAATAAELKARGKNPLLLFVDTGCEDIMESRVRAINIALCMSLELVEDSGMAMFMSDHAIGDNIYIPYRNLLFAIIASQYGRRIWMGGIKGDFSPDKSPEVFKMFSDTMRGSCGPDEQIEFINSPFWEMDKVQVAKRLVELEGEDILRSTLGCYHPTYDDAHCGKCLACFRRYCLFKAVGLDVSDEFATNPLEGPAAAAYKEMLYSGEWHENIPEEVARDIFEGRL